MFIFDVKIHRWKGSDKRFHDIRKISTDLGCYSYVSYNKLLQTIYCLKTSSLTSNFVYQFSFVEIPGKLGYSSVLLTLMKIRAYGWKLCNNKFTWCFHKTELILYSLCKHTKNVAIKFVYVFGLFTKETKLKRNIILEKAIAMGKKELLNVNAYDSRDRWYYSFNYMTPYSIYFCTNLCYPFQCQKLLSISAKQITQETYEINVIIATIHSQDFMKIQTYRLRQNSNILRTSSAYQAVLAHRTWRLRLQIPGERLISRKRFTIQIIYRVNLMMVQTKTKSITLEIH